MPENNQILSVEGQLVGMPLAGPESFSQQQLDYLKRALGVDETVLYEAPANTQVDSATLSENAENFELLDIYMQGYGVSQKPVVLRVVANNSNTAVQVNWSLGNNTWYLVCQKLTISGTSIAISNAHAIRGSSFTSTDIIHESSQNTITKTLVKVVGIHRISGGN